MTNLKNEIENIIKPRPTTLPTPTPAMREKDQDQNPDPVQQMSVRLNK